MKLIFSKNDLSKGINYVLKAVSSKTTLPILRCILIDATEGTIKLFANDMELAIVTEVEGDIVVPGSIALDSRIFSEITRRLPDGDIIIETDENLNATISCENSLFNIPGQDASSFPPVPAIETEESVSLSQFTLKEMIRQTIFSLDMNENNKLMTGELFELKNNALRMISLDGHRIAIRKLPLNGSYNGRKEIVPGMTLNEISKILSDNIDDPVSVYFSENHILFEFDRTSVYSRLIEGEYFHVDNMLNGDTSTKLTVNKKSFYGCLERADLLIKDGDNRPIILDITDNNMNIRITTNMGAMMEDLPAEKSGNDIRIGFNPKFLMDAVRVIDDENITLFFINQKAPCFIKNDEETYLYLILPVNIS